MAALQILAANLSGIDRLVFHTGSTSGVDSLQRAEALVAQFARRKSAISDEGQLTSLTSGEESPSAETDAKVALSDIIAVLLSQEFQWGVSDGN